MCAGGALNQFPHRDQLGGEGQFNDDFIFETSYKNSKFFKVKLYFASTPLRC